MHVRMLRVQVPPEKMDDFIQLWHNEMLPFAKAQKGWKSARLLVDREAGKTVIIGLWETEADARASGNMGSTHVQKQQAMAASLLGAPPVVEMEYYEVAGDAWEEQVVGA